MKNLMKAILISGSIATLANLAGAAAAEPTKNGQKTELPAVSCPAGQGQPVFPDAPVKASDVKTGEQTEPGKKAEGAQH